MYTKSNTFPRYRVWNGSLLVPNWWFLSLSRGGGDILQLEKFTLLWAQRLKTIPKPKILIESCDRKMNYGDCNTQVWQRKWSNKWKMIRGKSLFYLTHIFYDTSYSHFPQTDASIMYLLMFLFRLKVRKSFRILGWHFTPYLKMNYKWGMELHTDYVKAADWPTKALKSLILTNLNKY